MDIVSVTRFSVDSKGCISDKDRDTVFRDQLKLAHNSFCIDCNASNPTWISISYAVYLCLYCSGRHRQYGSHISFVRSVDMDSFTKEQIVRVVIGGNKRILDYMKANHISLKTIDYTATTILRYKDILDREVRTVFDSVGSVPNSLSSNVDGLLSGGNIGENRIGTGNLAGENVYIDSAPKGLATSHKPAVDPTLSSSAKIGNEPSSTAQCSSEHQICATKGISKKLSGKFDFDEFERSIHLEAAQRNTINITNAAENKGTLQVNTHGVGASKRMGWTPNTTTKGSMNSKGMVNCPQGSGVGVFKHVEPNYAAFGNKKGLSSDEMFGRGAYGKKPVEVKYSKDKTSLSSAEYFDNVPGGEDRTQVVINELREGFNQVVSKGTEMVDKAKQWLNSR